MALVIRIQTSEIILYVVFFAHAMHPEAPNAALRGVLERGVGKEETALLIDVKKKHPKSSLTVELAAYLQSLL